MEFLFMFYLHIGRGMLCPLDRSGSADFSQEGVKYYYIYKNEHFN